MAYTPTVWQTGDVITAAKLNNMEQGIEDAFVPDVYVLEGTLQLAMNMGVVAFDLTSGDVSEIGTHKYTVLKVTVNIMGSTNVMVAYLPYNSNELYSVASQEQIDVKSFQTIMFMGASGSTLTFASLRIAYHPDDTSWTPTLDQFTVTKAS